MACEQYLAVNYISYQCLVLCAYSLILVKGHHRYIVRIIPNFTQPAQFIKIAIIAEYSHA